MKYGENNRKNAKSTSVGTQNALRFQTPRSAGIKPDTLLGLSFTVSTVALAVGLVTHGAFRLEQLGMSALVITPALAGMWLGQAVRVRISLEVFRQCFLLFLALLGLELASRPLR